MADEMVDEQVHDVHDHALSVPLMEDPLLVRVTSQAPWWLVSIVFHLLLIVMAYMCSIAFKLDDEDLMPVVTIVPGFQSEKVADKMPEIANAEPLRSDKDIPSTDKNAAATINFIVPPDIKAEFGDHIETMNLERPDTKNAFGNPDSQIFHKPHGNAGELGGGGDNGYKLEDMIGSNGSGMTGSGGGKWGGRGRGEGPSIGGGSASLGDIRGAGRRWIIINGRGGSKTTERAVESALRWLAYHQESDGHWDAKKFGSNEKTDTAVTSLAMLAFLGAGNSEKVGDYKDTVQRGVAWLKSKQAASGLIFDTTDAGGHRGEGYPGAMATMAIAEAAAMGNLAGTRDSAQRAVNYCTEVHQAGEGSDKLGWRYHPKMEGDTSVTGWFMMALKSAKIAGLQVNHAAFDGAIKYLDSVEHKAAGGDPGYAPASTYWYTVKDAHEPHRLTAIGCLCRQYLGWKRDDLQASVEGFVAKGGVPTWGGNGGGVDLYYWYYGSLCTFQQGGDVWKKWNAGLTSALVPNQRKDGDDTGSWDPVGAYATEWGRVGETALGCLNLEVYYRYGLLNGDAR
jgi:hypothetical protein